jgi:hypothetical protein
MLMVFCMPKALKKVDEAARDMLGVLGSEKMPGAASDPEGRAKKGEG